MTTARTDYNPDKALSDMLNFLTGLRTQQGYSDFAYTVRELCTHLNAGGRLPAAWQPQPAETTGMSAVCARALAYAINGIDDMLPAEVAWLDNGQLAALVQGAERLRNAAARERASRADR